MLNPLRDSPATGEPAAEVAQILGNNRRLALIRLLEAAAPRSLDDVTEQIAADEADGLADKQTRKAVYVGLYQTHVPTLDDADVITTDRVGKELRRGPEFDAYNAARKALLEYTGGEAL